MAAVHSTSTSTSTSTSEQPDGQTDELASRLARLAAVSRAVRLPAADPVLLASDSNDAWRIGGHVLRICWRGDRQRFAREAAVAAALPAGFPYPQIEATGQAAGLPWQLTRAVSGTSLRKAWPRLSVAERRGAVTQVGQALELLYEHAFPPGVLAALAVPRPDGTSAAELIGADMNPVPAARALLLTAHLPTLPYVDHGLISDAVSLLQELSQADPFRSVPAEALADASAFGCVHGDAHLDNVLWHAGQVVALLDLEWVRLGPADLNLEPYLRGLRGRERLTDASTRLVLRWLARAHPAAFAAPDLPGRLRLYQLAFAIRHLLITPPDRPAADLADDHPLLALAALLNSPGALGALLPA